jgi:ketosteroid isomerase-like protein
MTDSPEAVLQRYFDAFARHALPEMLELLHEDVEAFYPAEPHRDWKGKEAAEAALSTYFKTFPDLRVDWHIDATEPVPGEEDAVAVTMRNRLLATGLERPVVVKYVLAGGKIRAFHHL